MYIKKSIGPSTVPWGTPEVTGICEVEEFSGSTVWVLFYKNDVTQLVVCSDMP